MSNDFLPLEFAGLDVFTTKQLALLFECDVSTLRGIFRNHSDFFIESEDFFKLTGHDLRLFKNKVRLSVNAPQSLPTNSPQSSSINSPQSSSINSDILSFSANSLKLWTKSGALKLSKFLSGDKAKLIYSNFVLNSTPVKPQIPPSNLEKVNALIKLAELTTDTNLREDIIKKAVALI